MYSLGATPMPNAPPEKPWYQSVIADTVPAVVSYVQQKNFQKENLTRMRAGQKPLSAEEYRATLPQAQVSVGIAPETQRLVQYGMIGLAVILIASITVVRARGK